jgi:hypothetical protein
LELAQTPARHEYVNATPARCAASSKVSTGATGKRRPEDLRVTMGTGCIVATIAADNNAGSLHGNQR